MKKKQVFYIHGGASYSRYSDFLDDLQNQPLRSSSDIETNKKWPSTLRNALGQRYQVFQPEFPNSDNAKYQEWKIWFEKHFEFLNDNCIFVCWSLGAMFITKYFTENTPPFTVKSLILLASPFDFLISQSLKEDGGDFYPDTDKVQDIQHKVSRITIMHSKDDFVVPYEHALKYKEALPEAELITFEDKNHFLVEELPELVELIKGLD